MEKTTHQTWHKFYNYLIKTFGKDLYGPWKCINIGKKKFKFRNYNDTELYKRLVGYEIQEKVRKWCKRYAPDIKIVYCDDETYSTSLIFLVPHPKHGITMIYIYPRIHIFKIICFYIRVILNK